MKFKKQIMLFLAGCAYALAFPFIGKLTLFPLIFFATFIFHRIYLNRENTLKQKLIQNLIFLWGFNTMGFYWLNFTLFEFGGLIPPFNIVMWQLFTLIIGLHFFLFTVFDHFALKKVYGFLHVILISLIFPLFEYFTPQQFPAHFGHPWLVLAPFIFPAQIFGVPFFSFLSLIIGGIIAFFKNKIPIKIISFVAIAVVTLFLFPIKNNYSEDQLNIKIIQANIGNDLKLKSEKGIQLAVDEVIETYKRMSIESVETATDLIIWPETAYPRVLATRFNPSIPFELRSIIEKIGTNLLIGTYDLAHMEQNNFEQQYNTVMAFDKEKQNVGTYHKRVLIPFGEGLPFGSFNKNFAPYISNISFFAKGENYTKFQVNDFNYISIICYEALFPEYVRAYLNSHNDLNFIVNLTNDSWYGPYSEQEQHLFLAKWRSIEFNLPLIRATNTGISSVVYPNGDEIKRTKNFEQIIMPITINKFLNERTIYQKYGIATYLLFVLLGSGFIFLRRKSFL